MEVNYNHVNDIGSNYDDQEDLEFPPSVLCKEAGILIDFLHLKPYMCYVFRILGNKKVNYNHVLTFLISLIGIKSLTCS